MALQVTAIVLIALFVYWWLSYSFAFALLCFPVRAGVDPNVKGHRGNSYFLNIIASLQWIVTDFVILLIPIPTA